MNEDCIFEAKVEDDKYSGIMVSVTHNGYQWSTIACKDIDQLQELYQTIEHYLERRL